MITGITKNDGIGNDITPINNRFFSQKCAKAKMKKRSDEKITFKKFLIYATPSLIIKKNFYNQLI